jgi:hypothetical protein
MAQRVLFTIFVILTIAAVNVWHQIARYIVHQGGMISGFLVLTAILLLGFVLEPYLD